MQVLSVSSLKGGVGKTTIALGIASAALDKGINTLFVDLDPQCDATTGLAAVNEFPESCAMFWPPQRSPPSTEQSSKLDGRLVMRAKFT